MEEGGSRKKIFRPRIISSILLVILSLLVVIAAGRIHILSQNAHKALASRKITKSTPTPTLTSTPTPTFIPTPTFTPTPTATPTATPTPFPTANPEDVANWDRLAQCETHGNWSEDTGNGYYGGLQFSQSAWEVVGGSGNPAQASRDEQILRGKTWQARRGWSAWSECAHRIGLY